MKDEQRFYTSGYLAQLFQMSVYHVRLAAEEAGVEPCLFLNDVDYYDAESVLAMQRHIAAEREAKDKRENA